MCAVDYFCDSMSGEREKAWSQKMRKARALEVKQEKAVGRAVDCTGTYSSPGPLRQATVEIVTLIKRSWTGHMVRRTIASHDHLGDPISNLLPYKTISIVTQLSSAESDALARLKHEGVSVSSSRSYDNSVSSSFLLL